MQMIGMEINTKDYPGGPVLGTREGRSSRLAEDGVRSGSGAVAPGRSPEQRRGKQKKTMISGGKVQLKEKQNRTKGGKEVSVCE